VFPTPAPVDAAAGLPPREKRASVLEVRDLVKAYPLMKGAVLRRKVGEVRAVDGISFDIREGEASIFKPDGSGGTKFVARVQAADWSKLAQGTN